MATSRPPFRADHVGSLLRPASLKDLRTKVEAGQASRDQLRAAEDAAIRDVVKLQEDIGLQGITDGEQRRKSWHMDFLMQLGGLSSEGKALPVTFRGGPTGQVNFTRPDAAITSRVTRPKPIFVDGFKLLKSAVTRTPKLTMPSPCMLYTQVGLANIDRTVYPDLDGFVEDTAAAYRAEIADLYAAGCRYLQLDGGRRAGMRRSPTRSSPRCPTTASSSSSTTRGPAISRRCGTCRRTCASCSGS
jgi:5-methyltetrahydropteroyltriglutamate--homocysteine methyltransferase